MLATIQPKGLVNTVNTSTPPDDYIIMDNWLVGKKPSTRKQYVSITKHFFLWIKKPLLALTENDLTQYKYFLENQNYKTSTIKNKINCIKSLISYVSKRGYFSFNFGLDIKTDKPSDDLIEKLLTPDEVQSLLESITNLRDKTLFTLIYYGGLRISEAINLKWENLKDNRLKIYGKGSKTRVITIFPAALELLNELKQISQTNYIFVGQGNRSFGQKLSAVSCHRLAKKYAQKAAITGDFSCHWLRHCIATHLYLAGVSIIEIKEFLGHADINTTNRYAKAVKSNDLIDFMAKISNLGKVA